MRYYNITLTPTGSSVAAKQWSSYPRGVYDSGALNIEFDMPVLPYGTPSGGQTLTIEGISLQDVSQATQFAGMYLIMKAGMKAGFPLANPAQAGTIIAGKVFQAFGNWEGTEMTLDLVLLPSIYTPQNQGNLTLIWPKGERLADALTHCLQVAYPNLPISMNISADLVQNHDEFHAATTLDDLAAYVGDYTEHNFNGRVEITIQAGKIIVLDKTYSPAPVQLNFNDFVGQPTWIDVNTLQVKTVMRADLQIGSIITMPKGLQNAPGFVSTSAASLPSSLKYKSTFQNNFVVSELRQIGNFRSSDAASWVTVFNCVTV